MRFKLPLLSSAFLVFDSVYEVEAFCFVGGKSNSPKQKAAQLEWSRRTVTSASTTGLKAYSSDYGSGKAGRQRLQHQQRRPYYRQEYRNNNHNGNSTVVHDVSSTRTFQASRKYQRNQFGPAESLQHRQRWLKTATTEILGTKPGSLVKGKWHELVSMIKAWSKYAKVDPEAPIVMERLIKRLLDENVVGQNQEAKVDINLYNLLLDAWCCAALFRTEAGTLPNAASQRAREILVLLQENFEAAEKCKTSDLSTDHDGESYARALQPQPNKESFDMVFDVVLKVEGPTVARRVLAWMEYIYKMKRNHLAKPARKYYIRLLHAYANSRDENAGILAEGFLRHMNATGQVPDTLCYNMAIKAWTRAKRGRESAEHADRILEEMQVPKDLITYSTVISAWSSSGMRSHAVARAEELLRNIEEAPNLEPNTVVLNSIMSTWVKSKNPAAVNRTAELLEYMQSSKHAPADLISYNTHLHALSQHAGKKLGYAQRAHNLLLSLDEKFRLGEIDFFPNLFSFNCVIDAYARSQDDDAAWNAGKVLRSLIENKNGVQPDTYSFNQVFSALSRCNRPGSSRLAEQLLDYMEDAYKLKLHRNAKADVVSYTSVIIGLARSGEEDAAERGERLLERLKAHYESGKTYMKPTRILYNALIDAWAKSGKGVLGVRKAEALLREMEEMCASGDSSVAPNVVTYNSVVNSWARSGTRCCGNKAEEYLDIMWRLYETQGEIKPNDLTFNTVINAVSKSQNERKAQKALRILRRMDKLYRSGYKEARPNALTYTSVLNAAAFPALSMDKKTKRKVLDTAIFTLQELQSSRYGQPNELTYSTFLKACSNLLSDDDEMLREVIKETFYQCKDDGQVGERFLFRLREAAPEDLYTELLSEVVTSDKDSVSVGDLPPSWYCNVRAAKTQLPKPVQKVKTGTDKRAS
eukprot:CAMPEP_0178870102 /NCGR_PEP_ID=MMETSP0747-20121128/6895_1 /TAXON_ID=913974 /ORGANISM="Nitzschia punctata, Strain CCMP561" /LENGTH=924 /DNA_ID=CAMNT_0020537195 /DNA_START=89 /DNA_END=2863 /DNA_ORIENTATION=+